MADVYASYLNYLGELSKTLEQLTQIVHAKTVAARDADLIQLNECMKQEQVISLSLRGMDKRRETMLAEMGLSGVRLSGLLSHFPDGMHLEAKRVIEHLQDVYRVYRSASEVARHTLECSLHQVDQMIAAEEAQGAPPPPPRPAGGVMTDFRA